MQNRGAHGPILLKTSFHWVTNGYIFIEQQMLWISYYWIVAYHPRWSLHMHLQIHPSFICKNVAWATNLSCKWSLIMQIYIMVKVTDLLGVSWDQWLRWAFTQQDKTGSKRKWCERNIHDHIGTPIATWAFVIQGYIAIQNGKFQIPKQSFKGLVVSECFFSMQVCVQ